MSASMPYSFTVPMGTPGRQLDPVRAAALREAVQLSHNDPEVASPETIITAAKAFEAYLAGEEAS